MKRTIILFSIIAYSLCGVSQGVKIGTTSGDPDQSAILDIESDSKGMLPPRLTMEQRDAIVNPSEGLTIFNTT